MVKRNVGCAEKPTFEGFESEETLDQEYASREWTEDLLGDYKDKGLLNPRLVEKMETWKKKGEMMSLKKSQD